MNLPNALMTRLSLPARALTGMALAALSAVGFAYPAAQEMPREDVVDVPAMTDGLCVSNLFQSNMVLQRDKPIHVWGWADEGQQVLAEFGDDSAGATADASRRWMITLPARPASSEPQTLTIHTLKLHGGLESVALENILVGDVWILGGQSNMEFEVAKVENGALEIASANFPNIRVLTVPFGKGTEKTADEQRSFPRLHEWSDWFGRHFRKGDWDECTPKIAAELSAIGYAFARRVHMASQVPIGVIDISRGGTAAETWVPLATLRSMEGPELQAKLADWDSRSASWDPKADLEQRITRHREQVKKLEAEGKPIPTKLELEPTDLLPGPSADMNFPGNCYAEMIEPLVGFPVKGAIFHQGYNNTFDGMEGVRIYLDVLPEMIRAWRSAFNDPEMPFGIISLCTDGYPQTHDDHLEKMLNAGIHIRAAQYQVFLDMWAGGDRNVGFASTYDLRRRWYHPQVKIPAGERIARWALSTQYGFGRKLLWQPPALLDFTAGDGALSLRLDANVADPEDGAIEGFLIAGADRRFQPATVSYVETGKDDRGRPRFDRKQLVLTSPLVADPIHFRYAWGRNPLGNLQVSGNKDLPFATQRSDDWNMGTVPLGVLEEEPTGKLTRAQRGQVLRALRAEDLRRKVAEAKAVLEAQPKSKD